MASEGWFARIRAIDVRIIAAAAAAVLLIGGVMWTIPTTPESNSFTFDSPRRDFSSARPIEIGNPFRGQIVDGSDIDYYQVKSGAAGGRIQIHIQNDSGTFAPGLSVYDSAKKLIEEKPGPDYSLVTQPNTTYYIQVWGQRSTTGQYTLTIRQ